MTSRKLSKHIDKEALLPSLTGVLPGLPVALTVAFFCLNSNAGAQDSTRDAKVETGKTPPPVFTIEVPGPAHKTRSASASPKQDSEDPNQRERAANQFFKDKQKHSISAKPKVQEASMRLSGSLCPACLKALATRFQKTDGVISATVELPSQMKASETETVNAAGKLPRYAVARVTYDANVLTIDRIKDIVRSNDLAYWKVLVTDK
jgi:copper chaperone CopZ